jgi:hypothetical protein
MYRMRVGAAGIVTALIIVVAAAPATAHSGTKARRERNARFAVRRAEEQLHAVSLPPGSRPTRSLPSAAAELRLPEPVESGGVVRRRFWIVPRDPARVYRWVENHGPGRFHRRIADGEFDSGFFDEEPAPPRPSLVSQRPGGRGVLGSELVLSAVRWGRHRSVVRIGDRVVPVRPRPMEERIPTMVTKIRLKIEHHPDAEASIGTEGEFPLVPPSNEGEVRSLTIDTPRRVAEIVRLVDRLRVFQPPVGPPTAFFVHQEEVVEPGAPLPSTVHLLFESVAGHVLAEASQREGGFGEGMGFAVGGKAMPLLEGGVKVLHALIPERRRAVRTRLPIAQRPLFP